MTSDERFILRKKDRNNLTSGQRIYGKNEPPVVQIETQWEVVDRCTGEKLTEPLPDFAEFSSSDKMYPSMMKPEVKARWDLKNREWENAKEQFRQINRICHAKFICENPDHALAQNLAKTDYGRQILAELGKAPSAHARYAIPAYEHSQPTLPQTGTGANLHDEFAFDGVDLNPNENTQVTHFAIPGAEEPFSFLTTARDGNGRIAEKMISLEPAEHHVSYEYDAGGRLSKVCKDGRPIEYYQYGKHGERLMSETFHNGIQRCVYGEGLRLMRAGDVKYSYDPQGRLTMKQDRGQVTRYEYDTNGQLVQVYLPDGKRISYIVDPRGMRIAKQVNGKTVETYHWADRSTLVSVADDQGRLKEFAYDEEGDPIAMHWNNEMYYFASDQVGTIYMVANSNGNEVKRIISDSFGNLMVDTNEAFAVPLGFAAGLYDRDTGLVHFGYREYDPSVGRFISPDPLGYAGGDVDLYGYCADDPVNFVDRVGLQGESEESEEDDNITDSVFGVDPNEQVKKMNSLKWGGKGRSVKDGPEYGNWGGGKYSGGVEGGKVGAAQPVDSSDEAYKKHDLAYERIKNMDTLGDVNEEQKKLIKKADKELIEDLKRLDADSSKWEKPPKKRDQNNAELYSEGAKLWFSVSNRWKEITQ